MNSPRNRIHSCTALRPAAQGLVLAIAVALMLSLAAAQSLDDIIEEQLNDQVEADLIDALEETVEEQIEAAVTEAIEEQIESSVSDAVEELVESGVAETIEQQVESGITSAIEEQLESGLTDAIEEALESGLTDAIGDQLESGPIGTIQQQLDAEVDRVLDGGLGQQIGEALDAALTETLGEVIGDTIEDLETTAEVIDGSGGTAAAQSETFVADLDVNGDTIERDIWVLLVPSEHIERLDTWGFAVRSRETLGALDAVLVTVTAPAERTLAEAALELALDAPGTAVDLNHAYRVDTSDVAPEVAPEVPLEVALEVARLPGESASVRSGAAGAGPPIGIIDTSVSVGHEAFRSAAIVQRDFVPFKALRPIHHGTAVASVLVGESETLSGRLPGGRLHAASVFFEDDAGDPAALTAGLVEALGWLAAEGMGVVNMSLSGPANRTLEAAIERVAAQGTVLVAAVGNNGPTGKPLYPAAYDTVIGVTAVDSRNRIYRHAARGPQVTFAAPGVRVTVARAGGGYSTESGTSIAAPHAAATIAGAIAASDQAPGVVLAQLKAAARRLGDSGFDDVFGFGLIAALE